MPCLWLQTGRDLASSGRSAGRRRKKMIYVYTGNGKGKTSACLGQVLRALGRKMKVGFVQFMKRDGEAGEQAFLKQLLGDNFLAAGAGFFRREEDRPVHRAAALRALKLAEEHMDEVDVLITDEILYAFGKKLITEAELEALLELSRRKDTHLILSGRGFPASLTEKVDLITEMQEVRHPWRQGKNAMPGLDY